MVLHRLVRAARRRWPLLVAVAHVIGAVVCVAELGVLPGLTVVALALLTECALLAWLFVALYSSVRWWGSPEGRHLMKFTIAFALTYSLSLLGHVLDMKPLTRVVLSIGLFSWTAWEMGTRSALHLRAKREQSAERARRNP